GIPKDQYYTIHFLELIDPEYHDMAKKNFQRVMNGELGIPYELKHKATNGKVRIVEVQSNPIFEEGKVVGILGISRDITARKRTEDALFRAQKLESVGILAGGIAHDFNNLLAAILGYVDLAKSDLHSGDKVYQNIEQAEKSCLQATDITKRLITFSEGGEPLRKESFLSELFQEACDHILQGSDVRCNLFVPDDLWAVLIDEGQMKHVIYQLLINAREAMPEGGEITVRAKNMVEINPEDLFPNEAAYVQWSVTDHGIGIPEKNLSRIFDPYFTTKNRASNKGMGLGLAICYSIVKRHDGMITVVSEPGSGATFTVTLPAVLPQGNVQAVLEGDTTENIVTKGASACKEKILVMDDEELILDVMGEILNKLGYDVEVAKDGNEAVTLYMKAEESGQFFTLVILDLTVHGGVGGEFAIRKILQINPHAKVVVASAYYNDPVLMDYRKYGFKGAISKPFTIESLKNVLNEVR
ncbi:MAG: ATP-binding protein, partial [Deltaproteobacteria bacterium]|nr:ATP-binding protein [Deltaproteobacteria bacterium]